MLVYSYNSLMTAFEKYTPLSIPMQKLLMAMNENGNATEFSTQGVYKNRASFRKAMTYLFKIGAVAKEQYKTPPFRLIYHLTDNGRTFINGLKK